MFDRVVDLNSAHQAHGTCFRVYPQAPVLLSITEPEAIWVSRPPGGITAGPADERMYVCDAINKTRPYETPDLPPWSGAAHTPALPDENGHFDYLSTDSRQFLSAHMYAVIRRVLDVWEAYSGSAVQWHFSALFDRLELIPLLDWDNAHAGFGFIESGSRINKQGEEQLFCLNFDVLAHEIGHIIIYSVVGPPEPGTQTAEYFGFHEAAADTTALLSVLHFDSVVDRLLRDSAGNLYALNELNRIGEVSEFNQIRVASNASRMSHFVAGWEKEHQLSQPLTGAFFDILVEIYHCRLLEQGLIDTALSAAAYASVVHPEHTDELQRGFNEAYDGRHHEFRQALLYARDYTGLLLAKSWMRLSPHNLSYVDTGHAMLEVDHDLSGGRNHDLIFDCFKWREIGSCEPGPKLGGDAQGDIKSCR